MSSDISIHAQSGDSGPGDDQCPSTAGRPAPTGPVEGVVIEGPREQTTVESRPVLGPDEGMITTGEDGLTMVVYPSAVISNRVQEHERNGHEVEQVRPRLMPMLAAMPELRRSESTGAMLLRWAATVVPLLAALAGAGYLRYWQLGRVGFNSDEAVYAGTAATMAGDDRLSGMFPVFRAHPLLFQTVLSLFYGNGTDDVRGRALAAGCGVATVLVTFFLGRQLYGDVAGVIAALFMAAMPYATVVSRQVLLDGPMTLLATVTLYFVVRYCQSAAPRWLLAAAAAMGLTVLAKETSLVLLGGLYAFFALTPSIRLRLRHLIPAVVIMSSLVLVFPMVLAQSRRGSTGQNYFLWQLSRQANHPLSFYAHVLPGAIGIALLLAAVLGLRGLHRSTGWRERLLCTWIVVPMIFFTLWPLKGYQYLLPIAPGVALLAARAVASVLHLPWLAGRRRALLRRGAVLVLTSAMTASLVVPTWAQVNPSNSGRFLAGTGGVPGGRQAGEWVLKHVPENAQLLAIGPSMANILQFYGHRRTYGLSVSANPRDRNPAYQPVANPDQWIRSGRLQYLVWDSYTADRTPFFASKVRALVNRYHGVAMFTASVKQRPNGSAEVTTPVIIIYQVWAP